MENSKNTDNFFKWFLVLIFLLILTFLIIREGDFNKKLETLATNSSSQLKPSIKYVKLAGKLIKVDLALTPESQEKGLSGRNLLEEDEGMLFVFDHPDKYSFWMKNMNFPLDIIWIAEDLSVIYIKKNALPDSYPDTFTPGEYAKYVLEVKSLFIDKNNLKVGDKVEFLSL